MPFAHNHNCRIQVRVIRTKKTHYILESVVFIRTKNSKVDSYYKLDNGIYYWEHELESI